MRERIRRSIEIGAVLTGVTGVTLTNLKSTNRIAFYIILVFFLGLSIAVYFSWGRTNFFQEKQKINKIWQHLINGATQSICIFAGDVSWGTRDAIALKSQHNAGVKIRLLCRRPGQNKDIKDHISRVMQSGVQIRYYDNSKSPVIRGLVIDTDSIDSSTAFITSKSAKKQITRQYGVPGDERIYEYNANRYFAPQDLQSIKIIQQLFDSLWDQSMDGLILNQAHLTNNNIIGLLHHVPHYNHLQISDIKIQTIQIHNLWSPCRFVKESKIARTKHLIDAYETQGMQFFEAVKYYSSHHQSVLLPPIIENHNGKYVVVDGMHRLYCHFVCRGYADAICLVIQNAKHDLPGKCISFDQVSIIPRKVSRKESFIDYQPELFRNIKLLDTALQRRLGEP